MIQFDLPKDNSSIIKVIGVGGGGSNAVNHMFQQGIKGVDFIVSNTDKQALDKSLIPIKVQLGSTLTQGLGAGSIPEVGKNAAIESIDQLRTILGENTKMVFITAGMGGGTGTGAAPVIAEVARELSILTVGIVTLPFAFEGKRKRLQAESGIEELKKHVDCLLVIANDKLREIYGNLSISESFAQADNVLTGATKSVAELISVTKKMNVDFNDVHTAMKDSGVALMSSGMATGDNRAIKAVEMALNSPLLNDNDINGANYVLLDLTSGTDEITMDELGEITDYLQEATGMNADIKIGYDVDPSLGDKVNVTIIATGFNAGHRTIAKATQEIKKTVVHLDEPVGKEITGTLSNPMENVLEKKDAPVAEEPQMYLKTEEFSNTPVVENPVTPEAETSIEETIQKFDLFSDICTEEKSAEETERTTFEFKIESNITQQEEEINTWTETPQAEINSAADEEKEYFMLEENPVIKNEEKKEEWENTSDSGSGLSAEEMQKRNADRMARISELSKKLKSSNGLNDLENEPAYKRRNISLKDGPHSSESQVSKFTISEGEDGNNELRSNNSFLHDNVD